MSTITEQYGKRIERPLKQRAHNSLGLIVWAVLGGALLYYGSWASDGQQPTGYVTRPVKASPVELELMIDTLIAFDLNPQSHLGDVIPQRHTEDGLDISPPLS